MSGTTAKKTEMVSSPTETTPLNSSLKRYISLRVKGKSDAKKKAPKRLGAAELQALFRRLDVNGDGELTFGEFRKIVTKLNMKSKNIEDILLDVFKSSDAAPGSKQGSLSIDEFLQAYNVLYNRYLQDTGASTHTAADKDETFVQATRYGYLGNDENNDKRYIFEVYTGTIHHIDTLYVFDLPNIDDNDIQASAHASAEDSSSGGPTSGNGINIFTIPQVFPQGKPLTGYNLSTLNRLILEDSARNARTSSHVMWWVDVSSLHNRASDIQAFVRAFGLPEEQKQSLQHFGEDSQVISAGRGEIVCDGLANTSAYLGSAQVLSAYVQVLHLHNKPMAPRDPEWLLKALPLGVGKYISSRLCLFYDFTGVKCMERRKLMRTAHGDALDLLDHTHEQEQPTDDDDDKDSNDGNEGEAQSNGHKEVAKQGGEEMPLLKPTPLPRVIGGDSAATKNFLLSSHDMSRRKPELRRDTLSLHIQDQGYGPCALLTYRQMDSELKSKHQTATSRVQELSRHARAGVLGRAVHGMWLKLLEVTAHEGITTIGAELDDSSFSLMIFLMCAVHNLSMDTIQSLDTWHKRIVREVEDIAVTKHGKHIEQLDVLVREITAYVVRFNTAVEGVLQAQAMPTAAYIAAQAALHAKRPVHAYGQETWSETYRRSAEEVYRDTAALHSSAGATIGTAEGDVEGGGPLLKHFGDNGTALLLPELLHGMTKIEKKGSLYWLEQLQKFEGASDRLKERYQTSLDEKRNFWSFTLGIVTIVTFPFAVMTGYFGMNFENMAEPGAILTNDFIPAFPGQYAIWFFTLIIYGCIFAGMLHYKVIHSAM